MLTLGIETSCDETSVALLEGTDRVRALLIASQEEHLDYGGVVPEIASRAHMRTLLPLLEEALGRAGATLADVGLIGVTTGPGLVGALLVGVSTAKALALARGVPLVGVNHLEAHIVANLLDHPSLEPPFLALLVSGGHTLLVASEAWGHYTVLGQTRDDAVGEAFDKVAMLLGLGFPGGPAIEARAREGREDSFDLPRPLCARGAPEDYLDFSYSGLKTAVVNLVAGRLPEEVSRLVPDIAASFQAAATDALVEKSFRAVEETGITTLLLAGGVACNGRLRERLEARARREGVRVVMPRPLYCTDNAAMVARTALLRHSLGETSDLRLNASAHLPLPS